MLDHTGHKCAFCNNPFESNDDVVVCPECGAPYHRTCYQESGKCVFSDQHGTGFEWMPEPILQLQDVTCPNCGALTPADSRFCKECGTALPCAAQTPTDTAQPTQDQAQSAVSSDEQERWNWQMGFLANQVDPDEQLDGISLRDWANFVGRSAPYYLTAFKQLSLTARKIGFSFSAFVFGSFYYMFRKMWKWGLIFFALELLLSVPSFVLILIASNSTFTASLSVGAVQSLAVAASTGNLILVALRSLLALPLYRKHAKQRLDAAYAQFPDKTQRSQAASMLGGTSIFAPLVLVLLQLVCGFVLAQLAGPNILNVLYEMYA